MQSILGKSRVEELLPQKAPFVMVDALFSFMENHIKTGFTVPEDSLFIENGRFAEAGVIEHMAQSVALYTSYGYHLRNETPPVGYIGSIKDVKIHELPQIGEELVTEVAVLQEFMGITLVNIVTSCNSKVIAVSQMKTVLAK